MGRSSLERVFHSDVVVAGAGVAGLTAATFLARAGFEVVCIDPDPMPGWRVGESLDWSARPLFERLGLSIDELVGSGLATYKRELRGHTTDGEELIGRPFDWLQQWPLRFETRTVHLDRGAFDRALSDLAQSAGVRFVCGGVAEISAHGRTIVGCTTRSGDRFSAAWFVDATGRARVMSRALGVTTTLLSRQRVSLWSQCEGSLDFEGTLLHLDGRTDEFSWAWEIPVGHERLSVGVVMEADRFRELRRNGMTPTEVFHAARLRLPDCTSAAAVQWGEVRVRGHRGRLEEALYGPNWILVGEAACFVDPITSIGVTSAVRHGSEAAEAIIEAEANPSARSAGFARYERRVKDMTRLYNEGVERLLYGSEVRAAFGMRWAARAYVPMGFTVTALYGKVRAGSRFGTALLGAVFGFFHMWIRSWVGLARLVNLVEPRRRPRANGRSSA